MKTSIKIITTGSSEKVSSHKSKMKWISILGDSISTFEGFNPDGYNVFYNIENRKRSSVLSPYDTWWGIIIKRLNGKLLINNSWSGSRVSKLPLRTGRFPSGCSDERTGGLHTVDVYPDIIIVYLGTNDWANGVPPRAEDSNDSSMDEIFDSAYEEMLIKIRRNYPNAEIWCCTLCSTYMKSDPSFTFPYTFRGRHMEEYCEVIRNTAKKYNCKLIDLYAENTPYDAVDGSHPTKKRNENAFKTNDEVYKEVLI